LDATPYPRRRKHTRHSGFSLIELLIVVSIALIAAALIVPNMQTTMRGVRLRGSGSDYANMLQQSRMRAIQDDRFYSVQWAFDTPTQAWYAFTDLQGTGIYAQGDPRMIFAAGVQPQPFSSGPALTNLKSQFLPPGNQAQNSVNTTGWPTIGPRGLPCTTTGGACGSVTPTSYITFMQNTEGGAWEAVTITPAGRIRQWTYNGTTWSPLN
jgi:prepilin-type N-terminal cleavage/methylation domain-containing protein